ncbi:hypothetical protein V1520DRAFT_219643 [Lipomyces starkeyi]
MDLSDSRRVVALVFMALHIISQMILTLRALTNHGYIIASKFPLSSSSIVFPTVFCSTCNPSFGAYKPNHY